MAIFELSYIRPLYVLLIAAALMSFAAYGGDWLRHHRARPDTSEGKDMKVILPAALTLLGLIIGFSFSMAAGRYDQRKALEEDEANAIGTEYVLAELVPPGAQIQHLLRDYTEQRILFYELRGGPKLAQVEAETQALQAQLWNAVVPVAKSTPTPTVALVVKGMNDVLNSQGYAEAMWRNRLPPGAWLLMLMVGMFCALLFGYSEERKGRKRLLLLPVVLAISMGLIGDMDSPRLGLIHVVPHNLIALRASLL